MKADARPAISAAGQNVIKSKKPREPRAFYKNKNSIRPPESHSPFDPEFGSVF